MRHIIKYQRLIVVMNPSSQPESCAANLKPGKVLWTILLSSLMLLAVAGCASRQVKLPGEPFVIALPEVKRVSISGNSQFSSFSLRRVMVTQGRPLLQPWEQGEPYDPGILEADMLRLRKFYFDRGFLDASATVTGIHEDPESNAVRVEIAISEGPETIVKDVRIAGTLPPELPAKDLMLTELPLRPEDRLSKEPFDQSVSKLMEYLESIGYPRANVAPNTRVDKETHQATVIFTLEPGERRTFGHISIRGAEQVPEHVIKRMITVQEGGIFSQNSVTESRNNIFDLGMFRGVIPRALNLDETDDPVDLEFEVQERKPRAIEFGMGISSVESVRYKAEWSHRNIFGEAQSLRLLGRITGISQTLEVGLHDPYLYSPNTRADYRIFALNNKRIRTDPFDIFNIVDPYPAYNFLTSGAEWRLEHDFSNRLAGITGLELTSTDFYNIDLSPEQAILEGAIDNSLFVQFVEAQWNNRNDNMNPTRGELLRGKLDHSNTALISDISFAKLELEGRYYQPLFSNTVLATRLRIGGIEPYDGSSIIPSNVRFFAGGPGSVRGYQLNRLGPLDSSGNPIGGNSLIEGSVEVRYPILGNVGGTAFVDFGNVFIPGFTYRLDELKYSVGIGLTYMTPVGPLRAEVAHAIDPEDRDYTSLFFFSIGHAF